MFLNIPRLWYVQYVSLFNKKKKKKKSQIHFWETDPFMDSNSWNPTVCLQPWRQEEGGRPDMGQDEWRWRKTNAFMNSNLWSPAVCVQSWRREEGGIPGLGPDEWVWRETNPFMTSNLWGPAVCKQNFEEGSQVAGRSHWQLQLELSIECTVSSQLLFINRLLSSSLKYISNF